MRALLLPLSLSAAEKPNLVIILVDDLGYGDISCYGATKIRTPNIDRRAGEGMKFTGALTADSVCTRSRYGMIPAKRWTLPMPTRNW